MKKILLTTLVLVGAISAPAVTVDELVSYYTVEGSLWHAFNSTEQYVESPISGLTMSISKIDDTTVQINGFTDIVYAASGGWNFVVDSYMSATFDEANQTLAIPVIHYGAPWSGWEDYDLAVGVYNGDWESDDNWYVTELSDMVFPIDEDGVITMSDIAVCYEETAGYYPFYGISKINLTLTPKAYTAPTEGCTVTGNLGWNRGLYGTWTTTMTYTASTGEYCLNMPAEGETVTFTVNDNQTLHITNGTWYLWWQAFDLLVYYLDDPEAPYGDWIYQDGQSLILGSMEEGGTLFFTGNNGPWVFEWDDSTYSSVKNIMVNADGPKTYYTLQGMQVANPTAGHIYIMRQGDKAGKILYRD